MSALEEKIAQQELLCRRLEDAAVQLPSEETLHELQRKLESRENALQTAKMDAAFGVGDAAMPSAPQGFSGLSGEEAIRRAEKDTAEYQHLSQTAPKKMILPLLGTLILLLAGLGLCFVQLYLGIALACIGLVGLILVLTIHSRSKAKATEHRHKAQLIALRYGLADCSGLMQIAQTYASSLDRYEQERRTLDEQKAALAAAVAQAQEELDSVLAQVRSFAPHCNSAVSCREALSAALHTHEQILTQKRALDALKQQHSSLILVLGSEERAEVDTEAFALDEAKIAYEERIAAQKLSQLSSRLDQTRGAISAKGDPVALEARKEQLLEQIAAAQMQAEVIDLALAALKRADETLRSRFSPQITAEAGKLLAALTDSKYPTVLLAPDLSLSVREEAGTVMRPAAAMSCGTADQMYLALRLAMCHQLLPANAPLILDDALVNFDDKRAAAAIALLKQEAEVRQVVLFSCRKFPIGE